MVRKIWSHRFALAFKNLTGASFMSLYRKRANTPRPRTPLPHRASDTTLGLLDRFANQRQIIRQLAQLVRITSECVVTITKPSAA